ncbi:glycosyltransferase family 2 protein [uncultured Cellulomonas sp.]|uniref:glycosyltransferase family 2 protein n=1 Tax=uncultured Cellulomonas sp. TaxID=189682 RepID=UPI0028ED8BD9|nr:glycosyltransferase family 2 protein [uncultured Cellulomonas sp.]
MTSAPDGPVRVVAVVVTYAPDVPTTAGLLTALAAQVDEVVVVDNGSDPAVRDGLAAHVERDGGLFVALPENVGIGGAQNVGSDRAREAGATHVLFSDQDSLPAPDMVAQLLAGLARARARGDRTGAVGPLPVDDRDETATLLFEPRRWGPRRAPVPDDPEALVPVAFLLASGCLVPVEVLDEVGPMRAEWFIDHVDLEWGLRVRRAGYALFGVVGARLGHQLGDRLARVPGRTREVHIHSPLRNYYMARNTLLLVRSGLMPWAWRVGYVAWIVKYSAYYVLAVSPRGSRLRQLVAGLRDGVLGRTGRRR